jgi:hypothetical protein
LSECIRKEKEGKTILEKYQYKWTKNKRIEKTYHSDTKRKLRYQNLWNTVKTVIRGNFIAMSTYIKITEKPQVYNLMMYLKLLEQQEQPNSWLTRQKEIIKLRTGINEMDIKIQFKELINKILFFEIINKIENSLDILVKNNQDSKFIK